jgi:hypothetical protein
LQGVYVIWFFLPLALVLLSIWAVLKPVFGVAGKEYAGEYFQQAVFCLVCFALAVWLDQKFLVEDLDSGPVDGMDFLLVAHWLLFPAVLLGSSYLGRMLRNISGKDPKKELSYGLLRYKR